MRNRKVIIQAKKDWNLFTLKLAKLDRVITTIKTISILSKVMAIYWQGQPTYFKSQTKHICLWYCWLVYISNAQFVRASKLINGINLRCDNNKKYNFAELLTDLDNLDASSISDFEKLSTIPPGIEFTYTKTAVVFQTKTEDSDILDKSWILYVGSKSTRIIRRNKNMTVTFNKLKKVHANL